MFALVKYQDGIKKIVPSSNIKHFDPTRINYSKKYKIKWDNEEYYDGVIVIVGDTETEVQEKTFQKRQKITPFELCDSADDTDSSMIRKTEEKNNNNPKDYIKKIVAKKIEKVQINIDKFVKVAQNGTRKPNGSSYTISTSKENVNKSAPAKNQIESKELAKIVEQTNSRSAVLLKKYVSSVKKIDSKATANVAPKDIEKFSDRSARQKENNQVTETDNRKPANRKNTQKSKQKDQRPKVDAIIRTSTSCNNINRAHTKKSEETLNQGKIATIHLKRAEIRDNGSNQTDPVSKDNRIESETRVKQSTSVATKNNGCGSCQKVEKKLQDATCEARNLNHINTQLKQALKDKEKMLAEATRLNMDLQSKVLDEFDELKVIVADMKQRAQENLEKNQGVLPVGYKRPDKSMIHLGQDVWITIPQYDSISCLSDTSAKFVKNLAIAVFGTTTLKGSSVTGVVSNRVKNKNLNAIARPKLDPTKLLAIKDALGFWLRTEKHVDEVSIDIELTRVGSHISHKIFELLRKDKKPDANLHANLLPEVVLNDYHQQDIEPQPRAQDSDDSRDQESNDGDAQNSDNSRRQENTEDDGQESENSRSTEKPHDDGHESDQQNLDEDQENSFGQNNDKFCGQESINDDDDEGTGYDDDQKPDDSRDKDNGDESSQNSNDDRHQESSDDDEKEDQNSGQRG